MNNAAKRGRSKMNLVAEICLYGNSRVGYGSIVALASGEMFGDGAPRQDFSMSETIWTAVRDIRDRGLTGLVRIFEPSGRHADLDLFDVPNAGSIRWSDDRIVYEVSAEVINSAGRPR